MVQKTTKIPNNVQDSSLIADLYSQNSTILIDYCSGHTKQQFQQPLGASEATLVVKELSTNNRQGSRKPANRESSSNRNNVFKKHVRGWQQILGSIPIIIKYFFYLK